LAHFPVKTKKKGQEPNMTKGQQLGPDPKKSPLQALTEN